MAYNFNEMSEQQINTLLSNPDKLSELSAEELTALKGFVKDDLSMQADIDKRIDALNKQPKENTSATETDEFVFSQQNMENEDKILQEAEKVPTSPEAIEAFDEENNLDTLTAEQLAANQEAIKQFEDFNPFELDEQGNLKHPEFADEYKAYQNLQVTDNEGKEIEDQQKAEKVKSLLTETAKLETDLQAQTSPKFLTPDEYIAKLKGNLQKGIVVSTCTNELKDRPLNEISSKEIAAKFNESLEKLGEQPLKASAQSIFAYVGVVNDKMTTIKDRLKAKFKELPVVQKTEEKLQKFDKKAEKVIGPKSWGRIKRYASIAAKRVTNIAVYAAVGYTTGGVGLAILAAKSGYETYNNMQKKAAKENISIKDYAKKNPWETTLAASQTVLSAAGALVGLGAAGEQAAQAVSPVLKTAGRILAVGPKLLKTTVKLGKLSLIKSGVIKGDAEKTKKELKESFDQTVDAAFGIFIGEVAHGAMNNDSTTTETAESTIPASEFVAEQQAGLEARVAAGEGTYEQMEDRGIKIERYKFGEEEYEITRDIGANADGRTTVSHSNYGITETTVYNADGTSFTQTDNESQNTSIIEHRDKDGNIVSQEARHADSGEPFRIEDEWKNFGGILETDVNDNPLDPEVQQNIVNNAMAVREKLEVMKEENSGLAIYGDMAMGLTVDHYQIGDDHYTIARDMGHHADGSLRISQFNEATGTNLSVTFEADGSVHGDKELLEKFNLKETPSAQQEQTTVRSAEANHETPSSTSQEEVLTSQQTFWDNRADKFLGEETTQQLYARIDSGEIKLPEGIESKQEFAYKLAMAFEQTPAFAAEDMDISFRSSAQLEAGISQMTPEQFEKLGNLMNDFSDHGTYTGDRPITYATEGRSDAPATEKEPEAPAVTPQEEKQPEVKPEPEEVRNEEYYQDMQGLKELKEYLNAAQKDPQYTVEQTLDAYLARQMQNGELTEQQAQELGNYMKHKLEIQNNENGDEDISKRDIRRAIKETERTTESLEQNADEVLLARNVTYTPRDDLPQQLPESYSHDTESPQFYNGLSDFMKNMIEQTDNGVKAHEVMKEAITNGSISVEQATVLNTRYAELRAEGNDMETTFKTMEKDFTRHADYFQAQENAQTAQEPTKTEEKTPYEIEAERMQRLKGQIPDDPEMRQVMEQVNRHNAAVIASMQKQGR